MVDCGLQLSFKRPKASQLGPKAVPDPPIIMPSHILQIATIKDHIKKGPPRRR